MDAIPYRPFRVFLSFDSLRVDLIFAGFDFCTSLFDSDTISLSLVFTRCLISLSSPVSGILPPLALVREGWDDVNESCSSSANFLFQKRSFPEFCRSLAQLLLRVHPDRTIPDDRLFDRLARTNGRRIPYSFGSRIRSSPRSKTQVNGFAASAGGVVFNHWIISNRQARQTGPRRRVSVHNI